MSAGSVNIGGTWKNISAAKANIGGTWKEVSEIFSNIGGVWKSSWSGRGIAALLADYSFSTAATSYTISGLNLPIGGEYLLCCDFLCTGGDTGYYLFANGDATISDYYEQRTDASGATFTTVRENFPQFAYGVLSKYTRAVVRIKLTASGVFVYQSDTSLRYALASDAMMQNMVGASTFTMSSITSLTITGSTGATIGAGSRIRLYKIGSE